MKNASKKMVWSTNNKRAMDVVHTGSTFVDVEYDRLEHLKFVQAIINRIAVQSSTVKNFSVPVAAGILAIWFNPNWTAASAANRPLILLAGSLAILMFYFSDAFFNGRALRYWKVYNQISLDEWDSGLQRHTYRLEVIVALTDTLIGLRNPFYGLSYLPVSAAFLIGYLIAAKPIGFIVMVALVFVAYCSFLIWSFKEPEVSY